MKLVQFDSVDQLRRRAAAWDDLWRRSDVTLPTARAELVAQWVEQFAAGRRFAAIAVEDGGQFVAALPLVAAPGAAGRFLAVLPRNGWTDAGDLLLDPDATNNAIRILAGGLRRLGWAVACGDGVKSQSPSWRRFLDVLRAQNSRIATRTKFHVGLIDIGRDWDACQASWSRNHRGAVKRSLRKLEEAGQVELLAYTDLSPDRADELLQTVCEVEDKSWKGESGSSILRSPGMREFYRRQARQLSECGQLEISLLRQRDTVLAGEYAFTAKGVLHSLKVAYDAEHRQAGPFRLLRYLQLQRFFGEQRIRQVDTLGILSEANAKWSTRMYTLDRVVFGTGGGVGNRLVDGYDRLWPRVKRALGRPLAEAPPLPEKLGAAEYWESLTRPAEEVTPTLAPAGRFS
jgi:CelD/BcsL family acetyltransferase involved in cellulose biosynthesis